MAQRRYTELRCSADSSAGLIRTDTLEGRDHLVVPVVMLIGNSVIQAANAPTPEFVPLSVLENSFIDGWNSRPVTPGHPKRGKVFVSANSPDIISSQRMGSLFFAKLEDGKLKSEAWLDINRCNDLGGTAKDALDKIQSGETIDVSIGAVIEFEERKGLTAEGVEYGAIWLDIDGDHLALLPHGQGACNQDMGCGTPRAAQSDLSITSPVREIRIMNENEPQGFFSRLLSRFRTAAIFGTDNDSSNDLDKMLAKAISAVEQGFDMVCDKWPDKGEVVYSTYAYYPGGDYWGVVKFWWRTYTLSDDKNSVVLGANPIEVQPKQVWETVDRSIVIPEGSSITAAQNQSRDAATHSCSCQKGADTVDDKEKKTLVDAAIATGKFTEDDRKGLEVLSEETLKEFSKKEEIQAPVTPPANQPGESVSALAAPSQAKSISLSDLTEEEVLKAFPGIASVVSKARAAESARKEDLVTRLSTAQSLHSEEALKGKSLEALEEMAALLNLDKEPKVDYSIRPFPTPPANRAATARKAPDPWGLNKDKDKEAAGN